MVPERYLTPQRLADIRDHIIPASDHDESFGPEWVGVVTMEASDVDELLAHVDDLRAFVRRACEMAYEQNRHRHGKIDPELYSLLIKAARATEGP